MAELDAMALQDELNSLKRQHRNLKEDYEVLEAEYEELSANPSVIRETTTVSEQMTERMTTLQQQYEESQQQIQSLRQQLQELQGIEGQYSAAQENLRNLQMELEGLQASQNVATEYKEITKTVEVPVDRIVEKEVIRTVEIPVEVEVVREIEVIKEVPVEVIRNVEVEVVREVEVPVDRIVEKEIIKEVPYEVLKEVQVEVQDYRALEDKNREISLLQAKVARMEAELSSLRSLQSYVSQLEVQIQQNQSNSSGELMRLQAELDAASEGRMSLQLELDGKCQENSHLLQQISALQHELQSKESLLQQQIQRITMLTRQIDEASNNPQPLLEALHELSALRIEIQQSTLDQQALQSELTKIALGARKSQDKQAEELRKLRMALKTTTTTKTKKSSGGCRCRRSCNCQRSCGTKAITCGTTKEVTKRSADHDGAWFFPVNVWNTDAAVDNCLTGPKWFRVSKTELAILDECKRELISYPVNYVSRYGKDSFVFSFEIGPLDPRGPAVYYLATPHMDELFSVVNRLASCDAIAE